MISLKTPTFSVMCLVAIFPHSPFDVLFDYEPIKINAYQCLIHANEPTSSEGHATGLWLVDFDLMCSLSMSKDSCFAHNAESGCKLQTTLQL